MLIFNFNFMTKKSEQPIASFFDGERNVDILPPIKKDDGLGDEENLNEMEKKWTRNMPTALKALTVDTIKKRWELTDWQLEQADQKIFTRSGQLPVENLKKYLNPELKESMEIINLPEMKLVAFENTSEQKANQMASLIPAEGPLYYSDILLSLHEKKETGKLDELDQAMTRHNLDTYNTIFYRPLDKKEFNDLYPEEK